MSNKEISRYLTKEDGTTFSSDTELLGLSVNSKVKNKNSGYTFKKTGSNVFDKTPIEVETNAVLYTSQTLTDAQKTQARNNIGASSSSAVLYTVQTLTEDQKLQARTNLGIDDLSGVPEGTIVMWASSIIPAGWSICNGQNGTPDLRGKFVMGVGGVYSLGTTGGSLDHFHYFGYHTGDNSGVFYINGDIHRSSDYDGGVPPQNTPRNVKSPTKQGIINTICYDDTQPDYVESEIGPKCAHWNGDGGGGISHQTFMSGNLITSLGYGSTEAAPDCLPPYYALYYIMKTSGTRSRVININSGNTETEITPDSTDSNIISGTWYYVGSKAPGSSVSSSSIWSGYSVVGSSYGYGGTNYSGSGEHPDNGTYMAVWSKISANLYRTKALVKIA